MIVVAGHICLDITPALRYDTTVLAEVFKPGRLFEIGPALLTTGGCVSNTGLALHKLGIPVQLMARVGDDAFGKAILDIIDTHNHSPGDGIRVSSGEQTSYSVILSVPHADRTVLHYPGANETFAADDIDYEAVSQARIFHFGYPPAMKRMYENNDAELVEIFRRAKQSGAMTSLDMVMPDPAAPSGQANWASILKNVLPFVDVFMPSIEEILLMLEPHLFNKLNTRGGARGFLSYLSPDSFSQMADRLLDMGASIVGLKAGHRGLYLRTGELVDSLSTFDYQSWSNRELWAPCFKVEVRGTTGAGDATIAGFLFALVRDCTPAEALTAAVATGACNVEAIDAVSGTLPWPQMQARIADGWEQCDLNLDAPGWSFDTELSLWRGPHDRLKSDSLRGAIAV